MWGDVQRVVDRLPVGMSCVATGSLVEGLGNPNSDVDLYLLAEEGSAGHSPSIGLRRTHYVDCEQMTLGALDRLRTVVHGCVWSSLDAVGLRGIDRYYRVSISIPIRVSERAAAVVGGFDKAVACAVFGRYASLRAYEAMARGACAVAVGSCHEAGLLLREASLWHAAHQLAIDGEGYPALKWTAEKAARKYGRDSARFQEVVDDCVRPNGTPASHLERLRRALDVPAELYTMLGERSAGLIDGVRVFGDASCAFLIKSDNSIIMASGRVASVCLRLAAGASWIEAVAALPAQPGTAVGELRTAVWCDTHYLRQQGYLSTR
jgi:hypothetical protein